MKIGAGNAAINFGSELLNIEGFKGIHDLPKLRMMRSLLLFQWKS